MIVNLSANDILEIQESLESYKVLANWIPTQGDEDFKMKTARLTTVQYLIDKCEKVLKGMRGY